MLDFHPYTILVAILTILVVKHVLDKMGRKQLDAQAFQLYCQIAPKLGHSKLGELAAKTAEARRIAKEKKSISAQDQYAKWTKLNRQFDKLNTEISALNEELTADKNQISKYISTFISVAITMPIWFSRVWYRKVVLFYLPSGVFPYIFERGFALPFMVAGSVGLTVWMFSVNSVVSSVIFLLTFPFAEKVQPPVKKVEETDTPANSEK